MEDKKENKFFYDKIQLAISQKKLEELRSVCNASPKFFKDLKEFVAERIRWARIASPGHLSQKNIREDPEFIKLVNKHTGRSEKYKSDDVIKNVENGAKFGGVNGCSHLLNWVNVYSEYHKLSTDYFFDTQNTPSDSISNARELWKIKEQKQTEKPDVSDNSSSKQSSPSFQEISPTETAASFSFDYIQEDKIERLQSKYIKRNKAIDRVHQFINVNKGGCLIVHGEPGSGKSSLSSYLIKNSPTKYLAYFLISNTRRDWRIIIENLLQQIKIFFPDLSVPALPEGCEDNVILEIYHASLLRLSRHLIEKKEKILVVIDGLDELVHPSEKFENKNIYEIVPYEFIRENVFFLVTTRPGKIHKYFVTHMGINNHDEYEIEKFESIYEVIELAKR